MESVVDDLDTIVELHNARNSSRNDWHNIPKSGVKKTSKTKQRFSSTCALECCVHQKGERGKVYIFTRKDGDLFTRNCGSRVRLFVLLFSFYCFIPLSSADTGTHLDAPATPQPGQNKNHKIECGLKISFSLGLLHALLRELISSEKFARRGMYFANFPGKEPGCYRSIRPPGFMCISVAWSPQL